MYGNWYIIIKFSIESTNPICSITFRAKGYFLAIVQQKVVYIAACFLQVPKISDIHAQKFEPFPSPGFSQNLVQARSALQRE